MSLPMEMLPDPPPQSKSQRGMVLIMTMLMLTMLSMLGSAAVMRTAMDLREGGAQRIELAAMQLSEAGTIASVGLAAQMQAGFEDYVAAKNYQLTMADMGATMLNLDKGGSFGTELAALGQASFLTKVDPPDMSSAVPGYDAGQYCFKTYRMTTTSQLGTSTPGTLSEVMLSGQQAIVAQVTVGPMVCGQ